MNIIISLLSHSYQAIIIGLLIVAVIMGLTLAAIKGYNPRARFSPAGMVATAITSLLLAFQFIPTVAAMKLKSTAIETQEGINSLIKSNLPPTGGGSLTGSVNEIGNAAVDYLSNFILKELLIALAIYIAGVAVICLTLNTHAPARGLRGPSSRLKSNNSNHIVTRNGKPHSHRSRRHRL